MGRATRTIPSTHTGSLPRPDDLIQIMWAVGDGIPVDAKALDQRVSSAIDEVVRKQVEAGVTIINDGEMSKPSYATYVKDRLSGFTGESVQSYFFEDLVDFPRSAEAVAGNPGRRKRSAPACVSPIEVIDRHAAVKDMTELTRAAKGLDPTFVHAIDLAASPFPLLLEMAYIPSPVWLAALLLITAKLWHNRGWSLHHNR